MNVSVFAALTKENPMGCQDTVIPDPIIKNHSVKCLKIEKKTRKPYIDNLRLFKALALHLHGNERLAEEISKLLILPSKNWWD